MGMLGGQAKAMVVTSSRKEAVRYKKNFDKYIVEQGYEKIHAMIAFSGEVECSEKDPNSEGLLGEKFTETYVLDFFNEPDEVLEAFQPFFQTAALSEVSDPNMVYTLFEKLRGAGIFNWQEVTQFYDAFMQNSKSNAALANICKPALERWKVRFVAARDAYNAKRDTLERTKKFNDPVLLTNAENDLKEVKAEKDELEVFRKELGTYVRYFEFMSQIVDFDDATPW